MPAFSYIGDNGDVYKVDATGARVWTFSNHSGDINDLCVDPDGYVYSASQDGTARKIDSDGNQVWSYAHPDATAVRGIAVDPDGNVYLALSTFDEGTFESTEEIVKIDSSGNHVWSSGDLGSVQESVDVDASGIAVSGDAGGSVRKFSSGGVEDEGWRYSHGNNVNAVRLGPSGEVALAGRQSSSEGVKLLSSGGAELWAYDGTGSTQYGVAIDRDGDVYSAGASDEVFKISGGSGGGSLLWTFTGHTNTVRDVDVDSEGDVYSGGDGTTLRKYAASDATEEWGETGDWTGILAVAADPGRTGAFPSASVDDGEDEPTMPDPTPGGQQFLHTFAGETTDTFPGANWTGGNNAPLIRVRQRTEATDGKVVEFDAESSDEGDWSMMVHESVGHADVDVRFRFLSYSNLGDKAIGLRMQNAGTGSLDGYVLAIDAIQAHLYRYDEDTPTELAEHDIPIPGIEAGQHWQARLRADGDIIGFKVWREIDEEPEEWDVVVEDDTYASGTLMVGQLTAMEASVGEYVLDVDAVSIGLNGEVSPELPELPGPPEGQAHAGGQLARVSASGGVVVSGQVRGGGRIARAAAAGSVGDRVGGVSVGGRLARAEASGTVSDTTFHPAFAAAYRPIGAG